jgi:Uma2 family endonuclease
VVPFGVATSKPRRATYQDVLDAPEHMTAEIFDGELVLSPRPAKPHTIVHSRIVGDVESRFGRGNPGGWWILLEPELHLGDDICVPDVAGWRRERMPVIDATDAFFTQAPDWICEVASQRTQMIDRAKKLPIYARSGVEHVWIVTPQARMLEAMRRQEFNWLTVAVHADTDRVRAEPFSDVDLDLSQWWDGIPPPPTRASEGHAIYGLDW